MHISKLSLVNYRNFSNAKLIFSKGINTLIGENASGKSNVFRAIRLLLDNSLSRSAYRLSEGDFCRDLSSWKGHWIIISLTFDEISNDDVSQSLFIHGAGDHSGAAIEQATYNLIFRPKQHVRTALSELHPGDVVGLEEVLNTITIHDYEAVLTGKSNADFNDQNVYKEIVGDFQSVVFPPRISQRLVGANLPRFLNMPDEVSFTFVKALRDVVSDFQNNRTNPLLSLLRQKSGLISQAEFSPISNSVDNLNQQIEGFSEVTKIRKDIQDTIRKSVGDTYAPHSMSIKSGLSSEAEELFQSLKLYVDETETGHEGGIHEMSLGGANLLYLTLKLLEFNYQQEHQSIANFLLIEEPEAHIHTHIQKSLFDQIGYVDTQIIYSTHSSHISEVCKIENVNIIGRVEGKCSVFQPSTGLSPAQITYVERYLDAMRSNLLFAKSVVLVEGDAEEILIPILIKRVLGVSLDELGISLINIRSTGFENIAILFHDTRIKKKCGIITDLDARFYNIDENDSDAPVVANRKAKARGSEVSGSQRKLNLDTLCSENQWLNAFYADHTFEVDFIKSGNHEEVLGVVDKVYRSPSTRRRAINSLRQGIEHSGLCVLAMAEYKKKGWFALTLAEEISVCSIIPDYIMDAIKFAYGEMSDKTKEKIMAYRITELNSYLARKRQEFSDLNPVEEPSLYFELNNVINVIDSGFSNFYPKYLGGGYEIDDLLNEFANDFDLPSQRVLRGL